MHRRYTRQQPDDAIDDRVAGGAVPEEWLLRKERQLELREAFHALPERDRHLLTLLFADPPMSYADIAAAMDMAVGAIGPTRRRALDRLRVLLEAVREPATGRGRVPDIPHRREEGTMKNTNTAAVSTSSATAGVAGIATVVLIFTSQAFKLAGRSEPGFDAPLHEVAAFMNAADQTLFAVGGYLTVVALVAFLWFLGGLWARLRTLEGHPAWRSTVVVASGGVFVAVILKGGSEYAAFRVPQGVSDELNRFAFDLGNLGFAQSWAMLGSMLLAAGWILLPSRRLLGWWAIIGGAGLIAARAVWTSPFWLLPYSIVWLWILAISVLLIRGRLVAAAAP